MPFDPPVHLDDDHVLASFRCGVAELDEWLVRWARRGEATDTARTYVVVETGTTDVHGYYSLAASAIRHADIGGGRLRRNTPDPVPVILLGRLAVDRRAQGFGLGRAMLKDAVGRAAGVVPVVGARALLVHAIDETAVAFYLRFGFRQVPSSSRTLFHPLAPIEKLIAGLRPGEEGVEQAQ